MLARQLLIEMPAIGRLFVINRYRSISIHIEITNQRATTWAAIKTFHHVLQKDKQWYGGMEPKPHAVSKGAG